MDKYISDEWDNALPILQEYIKVPNQSPSYDKDWNINGFQEQAMDLICKWIDEQKVDGLKYTVYNDKTPLLLCELDNHNIDKKNNTILLYGHMDKQPPLQSEWSESLGPYKPVIKNGKLYGRGGADDGYSIFASIIAIKALQKYGKIDSNIVIVIEGSEESGSCDLPYYMEKLNIQNVTHVICLDSGCANYDQLWITNSLRGCFAGTLEIKVLKHGVHSGDASGIVPSPFQILRQLLDRIEDSKTGEMKCLNVEIPQKYVDDANSTAQVLGNKIVNRFPYDEQVDIKLDEPLESYILRRTWKPTTSYIGLDGLPSVLSGGNVVYPDLKINLSIRLPPVLDPEEAIECVKNILEKDKPYNASVKFVPSRWCKGWVLPEMSNDLAKLVNDVSHKVFGKSVQYMGEGGSIPFLSMLTDQFPRAQFIVTGVLGDDSNAHGPDEALDIMMTKNVTKCIAHIINEL